MMTCERSLANITLIGDVADTIPPVYAAIYGLKEGIDSCFFVVEVHALSAMIPRKSTIESRLLMPYVDVLLLMVAYFT